MADRRTNGRSAFYLHPGRIFAAAEPYQVTTILGSCVAVCLWDPLRCVGGVSHYQLPSWVGSVQSSPKFGNVAVSQLMERLLELGAARQNLQAKIFGGACVIEAFRRFDGHLGSKNVQMAVTLLDSAGIAVAAEDVGGQRGRKLVFNTDDGAAWVKTL
ncbi:MAG TPA: chemotaxis protein CheD [Blastocatellia bacterium]|nr:chemotaxis protein CheD [Blastocatellia bacterium]